MSPHLHAPPPRYMTGAIHVGQPATAQAATALPSAITVKSEAKMVLGAPSIGDGVKRCGVEFIPISNSVHFCEQDPPGQFPAVVWRTIAKGYTR